MSALAASTLFGEEPRNEFFERRVRPILVKHCYECHSAASPKAEGGLLVDSRDGLRNGGESGPAVVPGQPDESLLLEALQYQSLEMPPTEKLPDHVIADFKQWVRDGAVDPRNAAPSPTDAAAETWKVQLAERSGWWSLQSPRDSIPPEIDHPTWSLEPVDRFIFAALEDVGLAPAEPADAEVLLRRLSFVLTGLPPTPKQVESFLSQSEGDSDRALESLVDELLESPHFGERIARHWMDVVRYTDTYGYEWDIPAKGSWEYRDYLIRAFNDDVGFDQLIREQIAGDVLPRPRINFEEGVNESMIGPMFYHLGEHRHGSSLAFNGIHQEMIDNKIDAFSKAFLAMTVACARCHDHKLDAVSQRDYYALAGLFMTPRWTARPIDAPGKHDAQIAELTSLQSKIRSRLADVWTSRRGPLASGTSLRLWALDNRDRLQATQPEETAWPFHRLLSQAVLFESSGHSAVAARESTQLTLSDDGTVLAGGPVPETDSYTVTFQTEPGRASFIRLQALTHDSLGNGGPGRTAHGNFVLSQIRVSVTPFAADNSTQPEREVALRSARADYSQPHYPVEAALNAADNGWGVGLGGNVDRTATFDVAEPVDLPHGGTWTIHLDFNLGTQHVLGRFRLVVGDEPASASVADSQIADRICAETWKTMAAEWRQIHEARRQANQQFEPLTDFSEPGFPEGWVTDGDGIRHGYVPAGTPLISLQGDGLISEFLDAGYHTRALSPKLPGALRTPAPEQFARAKVTLKLAGGEWAGRRAVPQNAFLNEGPFFFNPEAPPTWTTVAAPQLINGVTRVLTEISTASLNSNYPPRTGVARAGAARLPDDDEGFDKPSWFSVTGIVNHDDDGEPADTLDEFTTLFDAEHPATTNECWQRQRNWLAGAVDRWGAGQSARGDVRLLNWMLATGLITNEANAVPEAAALVTRYREVEATIALPRSANSMDERGVQPIDYRLNVRGDVYEEGPEIPRDFLEVFRGKHDVSRAQGSGRLELAKYLSSRDNPQTARVFVNRVWHWTFGTGIVATPSDFGKLGDRPSHPELLDWLTIRFMEEGWSTKSLIKRLVLSRTFRQSGEIDPVAIERDPQNRLLHHYPTRRLEAEAVRDSLLAVSGELERSLYGRPINPPRGKEDSKKRLFSGPVDSHGRRSLYIELSIMDPPKFLVGFNLPSVKLSTGRRDTTNVPAQALMMLNDPLVNQQAGAWADRLIADSSPTSEERIRRMFVRALCRRPERHELERWSQALVSFASTSDVMSDRHAWAELAHAMFNTQEFIYYR